MDCITNELNPSIYYKELEKIIAYVGILQRIGIKLL